MDIVTLILKSSVLTRRQGNAVNLLPDFAIDTENPLVIIVYQTTANSTGGIIDRMVAHHLFCRCCFELSMFQA